MTENRVPTTEAGRALLDRQQMKRPYRDLLMEDVLAIEDEAREQPAPPLDVERLEDAMLAHAAHVTATEGLHSGCTFDCAADILARLGSAPSRSEPLDLERLAEAWGNVMDGRRLGSERIGFSTTTYDDWKAIVAEYDRLAPSRSEPE